MVEDRSRLGRLALEALTATTQADEETLGVLLGCISISRGQDHMGNALLIWAGEYPCVECGAISRPLGYDL